MSSTIEFLKEMFLNAKCDIAFSIVLKTNGAELCKCVFVEQTRLKILISSQNSELAFMKVWRLKSKV